MPKKSPDKEFPFNTIVSVPLNEIDQESSINVRRTGIEENVELIKSSIESRGYLPEFPVSLRPHPDPQSKYAYENVQGQCRMKAAFALKLTEIPAVIVDLDNDAALQHSFMENSKRTELSFPDYTYWVERKYNEFMKQGMTSDEAFKKTAAFWDLKVKKAEEYFALHALPDEVKEMVDHKELPQNAAMTIVKSCRNSFDKAKEQQDMKDRAKWFCEQDRGRRQDARKAIRDCGSNASLEDVEQKFEKLASEGRSKIAVLVPAESMDELMEYGKERGLYEPEAIIGYMVAEALKKTSTRSR
ncbi:MAG: Chromosome-partitioning protein Spo0J [Verrucomicrobia subdivision 3 bacterium]|nr:Chromosome-partitioning protein Spo0J [Limisphaerales bacterium]MCS1417000.1 Chromosome-partitioning protein Spo0J [Limisphaerales bacterium]